MPDLPVTIDDDYADRSTGDKIHQQHHDVLHALNNVVSDEGVLWVNHGATAGTDRPEIGGSAAGLVIWVGSVEPTNATATDIWVDTSA